MNPAQNAPPNMPAATGGKEMWIMLTDPTDALALVAAIETLAALAILAPILPAIALAGMWAATVALLTRAYFND